MPSAHKVMAGVLLALVASTAPVASAAADTAVATIEAAPTITVTPSGVLEGNSGTRSMQFTLRLSSITSGVSVGVRTTAAGTATAGTDFVAIPLIRLNFGGGVATISVPIKGDTASEANETVVLRLVDPIGATVPDPTAEGLIFDDDGPQRIVSVSNPTVTESNLFNRTMTFTVTLKRPSLVNTTIRVSTQNGTALAGSDYQAITNKDIAIPIGTIVKQVSVTIKGDFANEPNETVKLRIVSATGMLIDDTEGVGTIVDND